MKEFYSWSVSNVDPCEVSLICIGNASYARIENLFNRFSLHPLFFFFTTKLKRRFLIIFSSLVGIETITQMH